MGLMKPYTAIFALFPILFLLSTNSISNALSPAENEPQLRKSVNCTNLANGNFVWGCSRAYSTCSYGVEHPANCPSNTVLNPESNQCQSEIDTPICTLAESKLYKSKEPFTCTSVMNGFYVAGSCSNFYFQCHDGRRFAMECPAGTVFDLKSQACDHIDNCVKSAEQEKKPGEGLVVIPQQSLAPSPPQHEFNPRRMGGLRRGGPYPQSQTTTNLDSFTTPSSSPQPNNSDQMPTPSPPTTTPMPFYFNCSGRLDGYYIKRQCSATFYTCVSGAVSHFACPGARLFDTNTGSCEYSHKCGKTPVATATSGIDFTCVGKSNGFYGMGQCQSNFVQCSDGIAHRHACRAQLVFNSAKRECDTVDNC